MSTRRRCLGDVFENCPFEHHSVLETLRDQPGQINCCVYAHRREDCGMVNTWAQGFLWYGSELVEILHQYRVGHVQSLATAMAYIWQHILEPWARRKQFGKPGCCC